MTEEAKVEVTETKIETHETPVEDINTLKERLTKAEAALAEKSKGFISLQQSLTQKDTELKRQTDLRNDIASIRQAVADQNAIIELQAAAIALGREGSEEELAKVNQLLHAKVAEQEDNRKLVDIKRQQEQQALVSQEYNQKADAVFAQAQTLFEGDDLKDIEDLLKSGNLIIAQREVRLAGKGKTTVTKVEPPKETEDIKIARLVKEQLVRDYPDIYKSDTGSPGGGKVSTMEAMGRYGRGEISAEEASKLGVKFN